MTTHKKFRGYKKSMEFNEIRDCVHESEKVRVYARSDLFDSMKGDRTLKQIRNVSRLPGLEGKAMVMPDGHEGYGFPIGGVAAFRVEDGVISPGGVGYDINCLSGDAKIRLADGSTATLKNLESNFEKEEFANSNGFSAFQKKRVVKVKTMKKNGAGSSKALFLFKKKGFVYRVKTRNGLELKATLDHPFLTREGMKPLGELGEGSEVVVDYFTGVDEQSEESVWASIIGYFFGDGSLSENKGKLRASAFGSAKDLESLKEDIESKGYKASIFSRERDHKINTFYGEKKFKAKHHELHVYSKEFCEELVRRGVPKGDKTITEFLVPAWVINGNKAIKRAFLAGFFGAELSSPSTSSRTGFYPPTLSQNKSEKLKLNAREFLTQILLLLEELGIECTKISERKEQKNRHGKVKRLRLLISAKEENLVRLWRTIGFEYNQKRSELANQAVHYILAKKRERGERAAIRTEIRKRRGQGLSISEVKKVYAGKANERFIERGYYGKGGTRVCLNHAAFKPKREVLVCDEIIEIQPVGEETVYDLNVEETHNFIANGFVVSNCGMRLLRSDLKAEDVKPHVRELIERFYENVPVGVGTKSRQRLTKEELGEAVTRGMDWAIENGVGTKKDAEHCEEGGAMKGADYSKVSDRAKKRGKPQLGTLGSGNHFLELQRVSQVFDEEKAKAFGLFEGQATVMIHSGSRGYGHQICSDYIRVMLEASKKYGIELADPELCCAPVDSPEARDYAGAMASAVNYAFLNRFYMSHWVRQSFEQVLGNGDWESHGLHSVYDVCHNIAKFEEHDNKKLCVHRKGATRAFWAGREEVPADYRAVGQPVIIPGSMQTASYVLCGLPGAKESWGTVCHGAGRVMSRHAAIDSFNSEKLASEMNARHIEVKAKNARTLSEEAGGAYKDVDAVVESVERAGLAKIVARLEPLGVIKG